MIGLGRLRMRHCGGISRRELLEIGSATGVGLSLPSLLRAQAQGVSRARARSVILLWLWGGPSHLDSFDPKPDAPSTFRGPYLPIPTRVQGVRISELFPLLAARADKLAILRSLNHSSSDHGIAGTIGLTGSSAGAISLSGQVLAGRVAPTQGSVVARVLPPSEALPSFVALGGPLHQGKRQITGETAGILGVRYDPFRLHVDEEEGVRIPQLSLSDGVTADGLGARQRLLDNLDGLRRKLEARPLDNLDRFYGQAFSLLLSGESRRFFDLEREPPKLRERYGRFRFGQGCLLARRLVEAEVRFVQVNWSSHVEPVEDTGDGGWDMHDRNFQQMQDRHAWMLDQSMTALLDDLSDRGLLDETIVLAVGEFGRSPKINEKAGRDHWQQCYSGLVAGGGFRVGQVLGASDRRGEYPALLPLAPADLHQTVLHQLGVTAEQLTGASLAPQGQVIEALV